MKLRFNVREQVVYRTDMYQLASNSRLYISGEVSFDSEWADITSRYLTFELPSIEVIHAYLESSGCFTESLGISLSAGVWLVSAHGTNSTGKRIDTVPIELYVAKSGGSCCGGEPYVPPNAAEQIAAIANEARDKADEALIKAGQAGTYAEEIRDIRDEILDKLTNIDRAVYRFKDIEAAQAYAIENKLEGRLMSVYADGSWQAYIVDIDYTLKPICSCDEFSSGTILDGGHADAESDEYIIRIFDGGSAIGFEQAADNY